MDHSGSSCRHTKLSLAMDVLYRMKDVIRAVYQVWTNLLGARAFLLFTVVRCLEGPDSGSMPPSRFMALQLVICIGCGRCQRWVLLSGSSDCPRRSADLAAASHRAHLIQVLATPTGGGYSLIQQAPALAAPRNAQTCEAMLKTHKHEALCIAIPPESQHGWRQKSFQYHTLCAVRKLRLVIRTQLLERTRLGYCIRRCFHRSTRHRSKRSG